MAESRTEAVAVVGVGAILPDAPDAKAFWANVRDGRYSITDVDPARWDPDLYYDPDPRAPDKTYSKIGGWIREWTWDPRGWRLPIPPLVDDAMDDGQKWAIACTREALLDYGYPERPLDPERTAVILGNAMAGERHYLTAMRIFFPEFATQLEQAPSFDALHRDVQRAIMDEFHAAVGKRFPEITEDTMPGELGNILAGRVANLFNFRGPNFVTDAACASGLAAMSAAMKALVDGDVDAVVSGGIDRNMGASAFVKFCKIGALSATGTRPYAEGADGFVMGEGAAVFLLKRIADAERDGDHVYAVLRSLQGSSDGKGKGITAPNPAGQKLAVERAWTWAGIAPGVGTLIEGHGTSTRVGDVVEVQSLTEGLHAYDLSVGSIALGSVKSNIGHLKAAAGAAGLLKAVLALDHKVLPPSLNFRRPNPDIDFARSPFAVNAELRDWAVPEGVVRSAGISAFGFGGTNFHGVLEEFVPGRFDGGRRTVVSVPDVRVQDRAAEVAGPKTPLRGALVVGSESPAGLAERLRGVKAEVEAGRVAPPAPPAAADLRAPERIAVDYADPAELATKVDLALKALEADDPGTWKALRARGVFRGSGPAPKVAFLYTGQGSQYANMLATLRAEEPIVREAFEEADRIMVPLLGKPLTEFIFVDGSDPAAVAGAEADLMQTAITQPAVLTVDLALTRLLAAYGIEPDMVMGHSLGEYGALVASGALPFASAMEAVSARGREMSSITVEDTGKMAAVFAPLAEIERVVGELDGYAVIANINSTGQAVVGGASDAVEQAVAAFTEAGYQAVLLPVSHAFHTRIVAPASEPLRRALERLKLRPPQLPIVANTSGEFYPMGEDVVPQMLDILSDQVASPVQFVKGLGTLYEAGARVFVEVGPKKALAGFAEDVLGPRGDVLALFSNHPKAGDVASFNQALCGLYAAGLGTGVEDATAVQVAATPAAIQAVQAPAPARGDDLERLFGEFLERARGLAGSGGEGPPEPEVVITGAALGLPGTERVFDRGNLGRLLDGEQLIDVLPTRIRRAILDKHITRLVKRTDGEPTFEVIDDPSEVIKLAGRAGQFDLEEEYGVSADRIAALDQATKLATAAGIDALRDAGIPLVMHYKPTSTGGTLPAGWALPDDLRDDTGVIFASAFPGLDAFTDEVSRYHRDRALRDQIEALESLRDRFVESDGVQPVVVELDRRLIELRAKQEAEPYQFDRRFLFKCLSMGHAQFAEIVGARGPNTQVNSACASTTQAIALAEDWIRAGRCRRVLVIAADDATSDHLMEWLGAGFLASGAAATDDSVEDAALPFDRRRHGMIIGMGAAAMVLERADVATERGIRPICQVLGAVTANSAFHGSRLDVHHIGQVMEELVAGAERRWGIRREEIAPQTVFVSHETYTPARGGSAAAEVEALWKVFGASASQIVVANTKGFTGHPMGVGIEDIVAIKSLETGIVPPVPNFKEVDPQLGRLNLSKGGVYPVRYALRLAAGFGSQISMTLLRWVPSSDGSRRSPGDLGYAYRIVDPSLWAGWLRDITGQAEPELEVVQHRLRVKDAGHVAGHAPAPGPTAPTVTEPAPVQVAAVEVAPVVEVAPAVPVASEPVPELSAPVAEPAAVVAAPSADDIAQEVLALVAEKTGYPQDMLELDLDLEADLGVDTVKQAEIFATMREHYGIARDDSLKLRDYPTLAHVIGFVRERAPGAAATPVPPETAEVSEPAAQPAVDAVEEPAAPLAPSADDITAEVLALVAEKTGYPQDMLELDLDLEADLGVDTVKQAEIFAAMREHYGIARDDSLKLREYPTLAHVIAFVQERAATPAALAEPEPATGQTAAGPVPQDLGRANEVPRRVPVPVLRPPLDACKPTGVELAAGSRVVVMPDRSGVATELVTRLESRGVDVVVLDPTADAEALRTTLASTLGTDPIHGLYWLPALDAEPPVDEMDLPAWREGLRVRVKLLYETARALYEQVGDPGTFLVSAVRLGGRHGYDEAGAPAPMGGAVTGFTKAFKRERPEALVKAVDLEIGIDAGAAADVVIEETLRDPGAVEIGRHKGLRWTIGLEEVPAEGPGLTLGPESVFVVTGAAGSIVSAIVTDLATASGGTFHLLDLVPQPDPDDPDLARFLSDRVGLKRELFERLKALGERATPAMVEHELAGLERAAAAVAAIQAVEAAGGTARYHSVNLMDAEGVATVVDEIRAAHGRIDVLLHAAGLEVSHMLPDKEPAEFDRVFDVKADGWFNLLRAAAGMPIGATVAFSSVAGRFGNAGQTDYSAANDLLCKSTSALRSARPQTRGIVIDWTAWAGIGMASRGSIPKMMELAGIDMLPPEVGIPVIRRELTVGGGGEVVIGGRLGVLVDEWDEDGGLDPSAWHGASPLVGDATGPGIFGGLVVTTTLDPTAQPFLDHHRIDGVPVMPGVMGVEAFAEAAVLPLPSWHVEAVEDVRFLAPFKFYRDEPRTFTVEAQFCADGEHVVASCRLVGTRTLPNQPDPQRTVHFTGRVRLSPGTKAPAEPADPLGVPAAGRSVAATDIYRVYFHGPAFQVLEQVWPEPAIGLLSGDLPPDHESAAAPLATSPRLLELCFQTAGMWEIGAMGRFALPEGFDRVRFPAAPATPDGRLVALVTPAAEGDRFDAEVRDEAGNVHARLDGYRTVELPGFATSEILAIVRGS